MVLQVSSNWILPFGDLIGFLRLNDDTSAHSSSAMKQPELWFGFSLVLEGALGTDWAQREIPAGMELLTNWGFAACAVMQKVSPVLPTPEGQMMLISLRSPSCIPSSWARIGAGKMSKQFHIWFYEPVE